MTTNDIDHELRQDWAIIDCQFSGGPVTDLEALEKAAERMLANVRRMRGASEPWSGSTTEGWIRFFDAIERHYSPMSREDGAKIVQLRERFCREPDPIRDGTGVIAEVESQAGTLASFVSQANKLDLSDDLYAWPQAVGAVFTVDPRSLPPHSQNFTPGIYAMSSEPCCAEPGCTWNAMSGFPTCRWHTKRIPLP